MGTGSHEHRASDYQWPMKARAADFWRDLTKDHGPFAPLGTVLSVL